MTFAAKPLSFAFVRIAESKAWHRGVFTLKLCIAAKVGEADD
jgi:hypothetical protein